MFGVIIYFELNSLLEEKLKKVKQLGGKRISLKKSSLIAGFEALIYDSEGNRIGIFSKKSK